MDLDTEPSAPHPTLLIRGKSHSVQDGVAQFLVAATNNLRGIWYKGGKVYFGSQLQRAWSMIGLLH